MRGSTDNGASEKHVQIMDQEGTETQMTGPQIAIKSLASASKEDSSPAFNKLQNQRSSIKNSAEEDPSFSEYYKT